VKNTIHPKPILSKIKLNYTIDNIFIAYFNTQLKQRKIQLLQYTGWLTKSIV